MVPLVNGEFYHVYNRGVALQPIFYTKGDYKQALLDLSYYRYTSPPVKLSSFKELSVEQREYLLQELESKNERLVELVSFCFMPNHFHFLIKQLADGGISTFMSRFTNSYTRFFNVKHKRVGPVFQGAFKAVHIVSDYQLIHVSRYIHINPVVSYVINLGGLLDYPWSSLGEFIGEAHIVDPQPVLGQFPSGEVYKQFVFDQVDYGRELENIKHLTME